MNSQLCKVCTKLNIEELVSEQGFALHSNLGKLYESSASFQLCGHAMKRITSASSKLNHSEDNIEYLTSLQARVLYRRHTHNKQGLIIVVLQVDSEILSNGEEFTWLLMGTLDGDPAVRYGARTARLVPESTSYSESTIQALKWLRECLLGKDCFDECSHVTNHELELGLAETHGLDD
ncbi:hypothetical protein FSHL1_012665 [Fusarium sambucinum]